MAGDWIEIGGGWERDGGGMSINIGGHKAFISINKFRKGDKQPTHRISTTDQELVEKLGVTPRSYGGADSSEQGSRRKPMTEMDSVPFAWIIAVGVAAMGCINYAC